MFEQHDLYKFHEPVVFKNILCTIDGSNNWKLVDWSLEDFADKAGDLKLPFRVGKNTRTVKPQWEIETPIEYKTVKEFLNDVTGKSNLPNWFYFDYKHMNQWFKEKSEILNSFNWNQFQLELDAADSTMWIGSKGAHTNCHQDTYGCNLIAQTHGKKLWLLFSPECSHSMQLTRIPYEESTIYSKYNFFAPSKIEIDAIKNMSGIVKMVILEPKDVLFVPKGWWHYVESLDTSLSVNIWLPLKTDCNARFKETLVHLIMNTMGDEIPKTMNQSESNLLECVQFVQASVKECQELEKNAESLQKHQNQNLYFTDSLVGPKMEYLHHIKMLSNLTSENINDFITKNSITRLGDINVEQNINEINESSELTIFEAVIDAFCNPEVILKVSQILEEKFIQKPIKKVNN